MLRHDFQPGKLVLGVVLTCAAIAYGGDADGVWQVPWFAMVPIIVGGLCLAAVAGTVGYAVRQHHRRRLHKAEQALGHATARETS